MALSWSRTAGRRTEKRTARPRVERLEDRLTPASLPSGFSESLVAGGLSRPTAMELAPDGRLFVAEQTGALRVIDQGVLQSQPFVSLPVDSSGERGLLGIAFDPNFASDSFVYVYYTATTPFVHNRVSRFTANGDVAIPGSEVPLLDLEALGPTIHNGGAIHFGPDGKLYVAVGENGTGSNAQTLGNRLGKMLRLNADGSIPTDNPFYNVASGLNRSIWALGLRNPFTFGFQPGTGRMFIDDVGQNTWEEIDDGIAGANYGWPIFEGAAGNPSYRDPLFQYGDGNGPTVGIAIVGGAFYNPATPQFPTAYTGKYFFADLGSGWVRAFDPATRVAYDFASGISLPVDLKVGADGSLYYLSHGGQVFRVQYTPGTGPVVIDDGELGFGTTAGWTNFAGQGYKNDVHFAALGNGSQVATWSFTNLPPGQYRVSATWSPASNRATNAPYTIADGGSPVAAVPVNQQLAPNDFTDAGASWEDLGAGPYAIFSNTLTVQLSNLANQYVIADAVRIQKVADLPPGPEVQVLDGSANVADNTGVVSFGSTTVGTPVTKTFTVRNVGLSPLTLVPPINVPAGFIVASGFGSTTLAPGVATTFQVRLDAAAVGTPNGALSFGDNTTDMNPFDFTITGTVTPAPTVFFLDDGDTGFTTTAGWTPFAGQGYQNDVHFAATGNGSAIATWTFSGLNPGQYRVSATWSPAFNRATDAPFTILDGGTPVNTVRINQQLAPGTFTDNGAGWQDLGGLYFITGSSLTVRLTNLANQYVIADAVRIERLGGLPSGPEIQVIDGAADVPSGTGLVDFGSKPFGTPVTKTFTVKNLGTSDLTLTPPINVPAGFTLVSGFGTTTVAPGQSTTFAVRLDAALVGTNSGTLSFGDNDSDENPFTFAIRGTVKARIVDNRDAGFAVTPGWVFFTGQGYQNTVHFAAAGDGSAAATWTFSGLTPGQYRVAVTWTEFSNRATNAPFTVLDGATPLFSTAVNQKVAPSDFNADGAAWKYLGSLFALSGDTLVVRLTNLADNYVIADAVRLEPVA